MSTKTDAISNFKPPATVKFKPPPLEMELKSDFTSDGRNLSRENSLKTPTTPVPGSSGTMVGVTPRDDNDLQHEKKKIGHRRVDLQTGEITYKKLPTSEIMGAIQLGITNSIGSLASKPSRDLLMQDFTFVDTIYFPREGSNITPSHSYGDFRFKVYAPIAFRYFRELFHIKPEDFLSSLSEPLRELSNPGASGSIFYISRDDQFIIKTVQHKEAEFLQKLLPGYYMNLNQNPRTLLPKFFGLYCYQSLGKNVRLLVMNNLLPSTIRLHYKYDLKGSTYKRRASKYERAKDSPTFKDLDFLEDHPEGISLEVPTYEALMRTVFRDCRVLESFKIMDYSLLLGIHNIDQSMRDAEAMAKGEAGTAGVPVSDSDVYVSMPSGDTTVAIAKPDPSQRRVVRQKTMFSTWESIQTDALPVDLDDEYPTGGIPARNAKGDRLLMFLGIIDILQSYQLFKKLEHAWKSVLHDGDSISVHRPNFYSNRFQDFMKANVFKKTKSLDVPSVPGQPIRKFRSIVQSYLAFKHSPTKKKRRGTISSADDGRPRQSNAGTTEPVSMTARPDLVPTTSEPINPVGDIRVSSTTRKLMFETPRGAVVRQDTTDGSRETKKVERLFASSSERKSSLPALEDSRPRTLNLESEGDIKDSSKPFETNL